MTLSLIYQTIVVIMFICFSFGPAFFALINTSIKYGYSIGSVLAIGIILSDFVICSILIVLLGLGAENFINDEKTRQFMGLLAGVLLVIFGAFYFRSTETKKNDSGVELVQPSLKRTFFKGFLMNFFNPALWLLWLSSVTSVWTQWSQFKPSQFRILDTFIYFCIMLGIVLLLELLKVSLASKLSKLVTSAFIRVMNIVTGSFLLLFGFYLIYSHYFSDAANRF